jgi:hypothetical protein
MDDSNQIEVPASFTALFTSPSGRLTQPASAVRARYALCEDLAQLLTEQASVTQFKTGAAEGEVLRSILLGLSEGDAAVSADEAVWVVRRLAELLDWKVPADIGAGG